MRAKAVDTSGRAEGVTAIERAWYRPVSWALLLLPLSWLFRAAVALRRRWLSAVSRGVKLSVPVVVVGNIAVGGTGKTPLLIALVRALQERGHRPGVISRGYGGRAGHYPMPVKNDSPPAESGDEPLLICQSTGCPVVVDPDRLRAARYLVEHTDCNLVLSDDGLQHYRLPRQLEIVVVDGQRCLGNGQCLPAGPLREPPSRLAEVDFLVVNGGRCQLPGGDSHFMELTPVAFRRLADGHRVPVAEGIGAKQVHGVTAIGNPGRFARTLAGLGLTVELHAYPDHYQFQKEDLRFSDELPVVMTAKDAVKCTALAGPDVWFLEVTAVLDGKGLDPILDQICKIL